MVKKILWGWRSENLHHKGEAACSERDMKQHIKLNWQIQFSKFFLDCTNCLHLRPFDIQNNKCHWYFSSVCFSKDFCTKIQSSVCLDLKTEEKLCTSTILCTFFVLNLGFHIFDSITRLNLLKKKPHNEFKIIMELQK